MAAVSEIRNHAAGVTAMETQSGDTSGAADSATISANEFLTLLVTEMQNQDPTATTDPNEYINQLVNVNSLEQLISINQTLTGALDPADTESASAVRQAGTTASFDRGVPATSQPASAMPDVVRHAPGNLGVPAPNPAAQRIAQALSGHAAS